MSFMCSQDSCDSSRRERGFSVMELMTVTAILMLTAGLATYGLQSFLRSYRTGSDARSIASQVSLARMRAASSFTRARVTFDTAARSYQIELQNKATGAWSVEGGTYFLSQGVSFGAGGVTTPAGGTEQTPIVNPPPPIIFNSRSTPVDSGFNAGVNYAVYLTNNDGLTYGVTVSRTGRVSLSEYVLSLSDWRTR